MLSSRMLECTLEAHVYFDALENDIFISMMPPLFEDKDFYIVYLGVL